jgi:hypothetical protein
MFDIINQVFAQDIVGQVENPLPSYGTFDNPNGGIIALFANLLRLVFVAAGIYAFLNIITAGFQYMTAAGDPKKLSAAWARIWQTLMGLVILISSFAFAAIIGVLFFNDAGFILRPTIYGP